jgi:hypothetical protein
MADRSGRPDVLSMNVARLMSRNVKCCNADDSLETAAQLRTSA